MGPKRSRATFEADLQAQQSPFVTYGTPLAPLDENLRDDGSYVPLWKQEVTDEQGRKRLHGAFTGGFSAGYFNTVGSKDGWAPSTFTSSRTNRKKDALPVQQRPEDFMDDEDRADAEEMKKLQTADTFAGLGSVDEKPSVGTLMDLTKTTGETMGVKLLKKMGWREGQGVGPKVRRKARVEEDQPLGALDDRDATAETHLFAPPDSEMIAFIKKKNRQGLGYDGQGGFAEIKRETLGTKSVDPSAIEEHDGGGFGTLKMRDKQQKNKGGSKGGIGMGILNDTGSDDEDPYSMGPLISSNRVVGGSKKKKEKVEAIRPSANPTLSSKPVFISKKASAAKGSSRLRRCHDGRLPLDGFILPIDPDPQSSLGPRDGKFLPPEIPEGWKSSKSPSGAATSTSVQSGYQSTAQVAASAHLSPKSRAALLGEAQLPGKSVFDYLNPAARNRIVSATNNHKLPPALSEADSKSSIRSTKTLASLVPQLERETALTALGRGTAGWMPYAEDPSKRARYRTFLEVRASLRSEGTLPERAPEASNDDWVNEMNEFARAAEIFKPMTGAMASRFTSSSSAPKLASDNAKLEDAADRTDDPPLITQPIAKAKTPAEEAASVGMYGPLTRSVEKFYPSRLLCKRFNVKPPPHVQMDPGDASAGGRAEGEPRDSTGRSPTHSAALPQKRLELVGKKDMDDLRTGVGGAPQADNALSDVEQAGELAGKENVAIDPERNEALEKERPGEAVFRAIFGSDSEAELNPSSGNQHTTSKLSATRDSSDGSSVSDKLSIRASVLPCDAEPPYLEESSPVYQPTAASSSNLPSHAPPPFSSLYFPSQASPDRLKVLEPDSVPPPAFSPAPVAATSTVEAETKAALPRDTKAESSSKSAEESEPPPPYTEGSSPLDSFTYVMAATGGPASIITQVSQGGPAAQGNSLADVGADEHITLDLRGTRFTLSRDELLTLPEFVLLSLFPNGLLPDGHMNSFHEGDIYPVDYDPKSLEYMLQFFREVAQTIPSSSPSPTGTSPVDTAANSQDPSATSARDMLQDRAGIIVLREDLDFYTIPHKADIDQPEMMEVKRAAGQALLAQNGIFSGLRRSEETGTTEQHLIEMLTAGGFYNDDTWGHRAGEPHKAVICSLALARLRTDVKGNENLANSSAVGMAQKLLLFWRKPARRCWWEGVELENVEGIEGKLKVWIRRVWTLEMSVIGLR